MTIAQTLQLALQYHRANQLAEARALYQQILAVDPQQGDALHLLGLIAHQVGRSDLGVELMQRASTLLPGDPAVHSNLGEAYRKLNRLDDAIAAYRRAISIHPDYAEAHMNLGVALSSQGRLDEALDAYGRALAIQPESAPLHFNRGFTLAQKGEWEEATSSYRRALRWQPEFPGALVNLGIALSHQGQQDEAVECFQQAIRLQPAGVEAHINLGTALSNQGLPGPAIEAYRTALRLNPALAWVHSNLLGTLHCTANATPEEIFREHRRWDEIHAQPLASHRAPHPNTPNPERRLRIGYVSADFRAHSVAFFLEKLLLAHDPAAVEVFCFSDVLREDAVTARFREGARNWREITRMSDPEFAELVRREQIDILVDLSGHTTRNRLLAFARQPAPVQVAYLGYCGTTGLSAMDYRLTDTHADPPGMTEHLHTEKLIRLPDCAWCFSPAEDAGPVGGPAKSPSGGVTFGAFNVLSKVTEEMLDLWSKILLAVPDSRILLKNFGYQNRSVQERVRARFALAGVAPDRIEMVGRVPTVAQHLSFYQRVDIALDTFPYHGTTTTCEALWMGVPVITLAGQTHASRVGVSLLHAVGHPELVADTPERYVEITAVLAADRSRLASLHASLRKQMAASPLLDGPHFARKVEAAYRQMWRAWCAAPRPPQPSS